MAEGIPGMSALATHLLGSVPKHLNDNDQFLWSQISSLLGAGYGLEEALHTIAPSQALEEVLAKETGDYLHAAEREAFHRVLKDNYILPLSRLLQNVIIPPHGLPIVTSNYDRLIELAAETIGLGVEDMFVGGTIGSLNEKVCRASFIDKYDSRHKVPRRQFRRRIVLYKPHGSLDWHLHRGKPIRVPLGLSLARLIITPGLNKFENGYKSPFDIHRDRANAAIDLAARYLILGYGFNDNHLETHLTPRLKSGRPCLILTKSLTSRTRDLVLECSNVVALEESHEPTQDGTIVHWKGNQWIWPDTKAWNVTDFIESILQP